VEAVKNTFSNCVDQPCQFHPLKRSSMDMLRFQTRGIWAIK